MVAVSFPALLALVPGTAWAAGNDGETVAVVALDRAGRVSAQKVDRRLEGWVAGDARFAYVDLGEAARKPASTVATTAASALAAGLTAYDGMHYAAALTDLDRAARLYASTDLAIHLDDLLAVYAARTLALFYAGRVADAQNQLTDLFTLSPTYALPASRMTPAVAKLAASVRTAVRGADPTSLEIHTDPVPAQIFVDGRYAGVSPVVVPHLLPGHHFVTAKADGYAIARAQGLAAPGQILKVALDPAARGSRLRSLERALAAGLDGKTPSAPAAAIARFAGAGAVAAVGVSQTDAGATRLVGVRVASDGHVLAYLETTLPSDGVGTAVDAFASKLHAHDRSRGPNGAPITALSPPSGGLGERGWGYVTGGTGLAVVAGGIAIGLTASSTAARARAVPQADNTTYRNLMGQANGEALTANVMYVVGAVGLGVGTYLVFAGGHRAPPTGGDDVFSVIPAITPGGFAIAAVGRF